MAPDEELMVWQFLVRKSCPQAGRLKVEQRKNVVRCPGDVFQDNADVEDSKEKLFFRE